MQSPTGNSVPESGLRMSTNYLRFVLTDSSTSWFKTSMAIIGLHLISAFLVPDSFLSMSVKAITGAVILLFLPGLATQRFMSAGQSPHIVETLAFSVGISVITTIVLSALVNFSPAGLATTPILLVILLYIVTVSIFAMLKEFQCLQRNKI